MNINELTSEIQKIAVARGLELRRINVIQSTYYDHPFYNGVRRTMLDTTVFYSREDGKNESNFTVRAGNYMHNAIPELLTKVKEEIARLELSTVAQDDNEIDL